MLRSFCPKQSIKTKTYTIKITTSIHCQLKDFNSLLVFKDFILLKRCRAPPSTVPLHLSLCLFNLCTLCPPLCRSVLYLYYIFCVGRNKLKKETILIEGTEKVPFGKLSPKDCYSTIFWAFYVILNLLNNKGD